MGSAAARGQRRRLPRPRVSDSQPPIRSSLPALPHRQRGHFAVLPFPPPPPPPHGQLHVLAIVLVLLVLLSSLLASVHCQPDQQPEQHHVYYSASHITSIAVHDVSKELYANDLAHNRVLHYNSTTGSLIAAWNISDPSPYSPGSVARMRPDEDGGIVFVSDSTAGRLLRVQSATGREDKGQGSLSMPEELWECGVVIANDGTDNSVYIADRYRGWLARFRADGSTTPLWKIDPKTMNSTVSSVYFASLAVQGEASGILFVVDSLNDRVLLLDSGGGSYLNRLTLELPDHVSGLVAVSWTFCDFDDGNGCLWLLYRPDGELTGQSRIIAVSVNQSLQVLYDWTVDGGEKRGAERVGAVGGSSPEVGMLASPAFAVVGSGGDSDPFLVYMAGSDPSGAGQLVVKRDGTNGSFLQQYGSLPPLYDESNRTTHAFNSIAVDPDTCTMWLTDVDNGGMLVRALPDGAVLQHFPTPTLISTIALDLNADISTPLLLSSNETSWEVWRFTPANASFALLNTSTAYRIYDQRSRGVGGRPAIAAASATGLAVTSKGLLLLSLTYADTVILLTGDGELDPSFNASDVQLVRPGAVCMDMTTDDNVYVLDASRLLRLSITGSELANLSIEARMSQPLAVMVTSEQMLWVSDTNGLLFRLNFMTLSILQIYQPMPAAYDMRSLASDIDKTLYAVDSASRRLIMLFIGQNDHFTPKHQDCGELPPLPSSTGLLQSSTGLLLSSSSSSSSSSSTGPIQPPPAGPSSGLLSSTVTLIVVIVIAVVLAASLSAYCWLRRRWSSSHRESAALAHQEAGDYVQWEAECAVEPSQQERRSAVDDELPGRMRSEPREVVDKQQHAVSPSDSRYDVYVRLYEALSDAQRDECEWQRKQSPHTPPSASNHSSDHDSGGSNDRSSSFFTPPLHSSGSTSSLQPSRRSSGEDSGHSSTGSFSPAPTRPRPLPPAHHPSAIARLSSRVNPSVLPQFISEVTDLRILGEGLSGCAYCGYYEGVAVVVKLPKMREMSAAQWREWQAHLRLGIHPNIVRFIGSMVMEDNNYLVLKWVRQGSLKSLLDSPSATTTARWYRRPYAVMRAALDMARALRHVHHHGLVHRDVSARNVLVDTDGTFVLADFGLCQESGALTNAPIPLRWCAPESVSSSRHCGKSDVWAVGVTMWEMTSGGQLPYAAVADRRQLQHGIESGKLRLSVEERWVRAYAETEERGLVGRVCRLMERALTAEPEQRPDSETLVALVERELSDWETEAGEAALRVKQQWADDHWAAVAAEARAEAAAKEAAAAA